MAEEGYQNRKAYLGGVAEGKSSVRLKPV